MSYLYEIQWREGICTLMIKILMCADRLLGEEKGYSELT